jgi:transposase
LAGSTRRSSRSSSATRIYEILEARGFEVLLVNARHLKNVPGRKSDVSDAEWLRELHSVGLLRGSFRPPDAIVALRAYLRHRQTLIESAGTYVQRMQKALVQMNLQLPLVVSDITGVTGLRILRDIVAGHRDADHLAQHRDRRCRASKADIVAALTGNYRSEHLFVLKQNLELFDACQTQLTACDLALETHIRTLTAHMALPVALLPAPRVTKKPRNNEPRFEIRALLHQLTTGVDLSQIDGIAPYTALKLLSEIGTDMSRWPTEKHFTSWLTLAPKNKISGGRLLSSRTQPSANRAAAILRMTAMTLGRTQTALGAFYRRLATRIGKPQAVTATARKLAVLSIARSRVNSCIRIPVPKPMTFSSERASYAGSANAPQRLASASSIVKPARSWSSRFLSVGTKFLGRLNSPATCAVRQSKLIDLNGRPSAAIFAYASGPWAIAALARDWQ